MKKYIFAAACLICFGGLFALSNDTNQLSSQMESSYKSGFYPGVIRYAEEILKSDSTSITGVRASVYKGESLFRMGRVGEAQRTLSEHYLRSEDSESLYVNSARNFWLGRCYFESRDYFSAQKYFFASAVDFQKVKASKNKNDYYFLSILWGSRCYVNLDEKKNAVPLLEYVVSNGQKFTQAEFEECAENLGISYNYIGEFQKAEDLCVQVLDGLVNGEKSDFFYSIMILRGDALCGLGKYAEGYELYCKVLAEADSVLAAHAMEKAYDVSSSHRGEVGSEPGSVLAKAESRLSEYPDLLGEFWTRLAVDAYNSGDSKKSLKYFDEASPTASPSQLAIAAVYRGQIAYETNKNEKGAESASKILEAAVSSLKLAENSPDLNLLNMNLARFYGYQKKWNKCETAASLCLDSTDAEILKNAYYWLALAQYENGLSEKAALSVKEYESRISIDLSPENDPELLNLYAKALAKNGKYSAADQIFYALGEKGKLNNSGHLDYSRTLLKGGHYISTKAQAKLASGDEALYLSSLASFNQRRWEEAESGFAKTSVSSSLNAEHVAYSRFYLGYAQYQLGEYEKSVASLSQFVQKNPRHPLAWSANMTCARSAAFIKNFEKAISASTEAVLTSASVEDKQEAVLLHAGILTEATYYDEALQVLSAYVEQKTSFGYECKFRSAEIYVLKKDVRKADAYFGDLAALNSVKDAEAVCEDSAYRLGEIHYSAENYRKSQVYFDNYLKKFPKGKFRFAAIYFSADCMAKNDSRERAILRYLQIVDSKEQTTYRYGSEKNMVELYEELGEYSNAVKMANRMLEEYGSQAVADGMVDKIRELSKKEDAKNKPVEISAAAALPKDASMDQMVIAKATDLRNLGNNKKAAETYLEAAVYARQTGNSKSAARAMYGAVEAFDAAAMYGDAKATYLEMVKMYPDDEYTKAAKKLVE
ncbi:MAG: tetratricopeptide repeat protein [Treponema sp.]|nr:tetratricopeptide repeat protein [Candidatus Treponema equifaecale]